ncbi:DUF3413 domain-containing protein [Shewanella submarina]|uniref:DUF3413 domain-containing protein n=1 Tax=Shewanella submarina TaxID=2016376 RepID=A0ABV7GEU8_9GAMM|nr:DUF3413 domain-containing protein [Shewanella submarina]MCL1035700.1 DUF3413 domain-containing protein [Shewanella submarina]
MRNRILNHGVMFIITSLLASAIAGLYFSYLPDGQNALSLGYLTVATLGQMGLLIGLWSLLCLPLVFIRCFKVRAVLTGLAFALPLLALYTDTQVFAQYRFHIQWVLVEMILSGGMVEPTLSNLLTIAAGSLMTLALMTGSYLLISRFANWQRYPLNKGFLALLFICLLATHFTHIWAAANAVQSITAQNRYLPLFYPATANSLMRKWGWLDEEKLARQKQMQLKNGGTLDYPKTPLQLEQQTRPVNIVMIVVDSWRWDAMTKAYSPNIWQFAQQARQFDNHLSTGNATRAGIFGLFYGMPATYWQSFYANRRSPVLMDVLQQRDYQLGIFASAHLQKPEFDQTVFANVPDLRLRSKADSVTGRDEEITDLWLDWNSHRDQNKPAFSFLFYDAPHMYTFPADYPVKFEPMAETVDYMAFDNDYDASLMRNRYMTSAHYVDSLVGKVLDSLKQSPDWDNTLVIVTGDHGQELNDNHLNFWGHNSNFTDAQIKVPLIIAGPGIKAGMETQTTSHADIAPTLLSRYLGLDNPLSDYSTGDDLLNPQPRPYQLLASYTDYALVSNRNILAVSGTNGGYQLLDKQYHAIAGDPDFTQLQRAMGQMRQFLK